MRVIKFIGTALLFILVMLTSYSAWVVLSFGDIEQEELLALYGDESNRVARLEDLEIHYRAEGNGPAVLLLHSHYFSMRMWDAWAEQLAPFFTVIRYDMASHGLTGPDMKNDYSMERDLEYITSLTEHLGVSTYSVVGSSLGGNLAFNLAARYPDQVENLVLINSGGLRRPGSRSESGTVPSWFDEAMYLFPPSMYRGFLQWMIHDDALVTDSVVDEFHSMFRRAGNRSAEAERLRQFRPTDPDTVLASIRQPVLIMWGEENPQLPVALAEVFQQKLVNANFVELRTFPNAGHVLPLELPEASARVTADFLLANRNRGTGN